MNRIQERTTNAPYTDEIRREQILRQRAAARRKRQRRRRQAALALSVCAMIVIMCIVMIVVLSISEVDFPGTTVETGTDVADTNDVVTGSDKSKVLQDDDEKTVKKSVYETYDYYRVENLQRYNEYQKKYPQMPPDEVVWRVNAYLDKPKYEFDVPASGYEDPYIIVNKYYTVPAGYRPPDLKSFDGQLLREETGNAYKQMRADAAKQGLSIRVVSGYRTVEYQQGLYNRYLGSDSRENVDRYSARPGHSEHHTGMAMDIFGSRDGLREFEHTPEYPWVRDNCYKYGFIIRYLEETEEITGYESEPWHLRYVGVEVSTDMKKKRINNFEEYHAKYLE